MDPGNKPRDDELNVSADDLDAKDKLVLEGCSGV